MAGENIEKVKYVSSVLNKLENATRQYLVAIADQGVISSGRLKFCLWWFQKGLWAHMARHGRSWRNVYFLAGTLLQSTDISSRMNLAKSVTSCFTEAISRASR